MQYDETSCLPVNILRRTLAAVLMCMLATNTQAATDDERAQAERLQQRSVDRLEQEEIRLNPNRPVKGFDTETLIPKKDAQSAADTLACKAIVDIKLSGVSLLNRKEQFDITRPYISSCMTVADLESLMGEITSVYIRRGYITTRAYLPEQDIASGKLNILVVEGRIESYDKVGKDAKLLKPSLLSPALVGDKLNIRDLEQTVDNANGLGRGKVSFDIAPGEVPGKSIIRLKLDEPKRGFGSLSMDNQGSESTGKNNYSLSLSSGNLIGLNELWTLVHRSSMPNSEDQGSDNTSLSVNFPMGYGMLELKAARSQFSTATVTDLDRKLIFSGFTDTLDVAYGRTIHRDKTDKHHLKLKLGMAENESFVDDTLLEVSSKRLVRLTLDYNATLRRPSGTYSFSPSLVMGLTPLNNLPDDVNLPADGDQAEFALVKFHGTYRRPMTIRESKYRWDTKLQMQLGHDELFSSEQMLIGSSSSVRGFKDHSFSASRGAYWQNEFSKLIERNTAWGRLKVRPYIALDIGRVHSRFDGEQSGTLAGSVVGLNLDVKNLALELSFAKGLDNHSDLQSEGTLAEGRVTVRF